MDAIKYDEVTIGLGVLALALYVARKMTEPTSMVHPMLLGRQVDASLVRQPGESALYRNFGVGAGTPLPTRPLPRPCTVLDFMQDDTQPARYLWDVKITNESLRNKVASLASGFLQTVHLQPRDSNVLILLNDSFEFLLSDLALASLSIPTLTLTRLSLLADVLEAYPPSAIIIDVEYLDHLLELLVDHVEQHGSVSVLVVGDAYGQGPAKGKKAGVPVFDWNDLSVTEKTDALNNVSPPTPDDVFTVSFSDIDDVHHPKGVQLTHVNVTAGVLALQHIFPMSKTWSPEDSVVSSHSLSSPFGRAVAYTALLKGCSLNTLSPNSVQPDVTPTFGGLIRLAENSKLSPTVLIISSELYTEIALAILNSAKKSWLFGYAWRHKFSALLHGDLSNATIWDSLVFNGARSTVLGRKLAQSLNRILITGDPIPSSSLAPFRIAFSIPAVRSFVLSVAAGPVFASHPLDLQVFPEDQLASSDASDLQASAHVGPPVSNIEAKLLGVSDVDVESGSDPIGELCIRGPSIGQPVPLNLERSSDGWTNTKLTARVSSNGTFKVQGARL